MVRCPVGEAAVVVLWLSQWNREGPSARSRHDQQVTLAGFVPEDAFAVDPGGVIAQIQEQESMVSEGINEGFHVNPCLAKNASRVPTARSR